MPYSEGPWTVNEPPDCLAVLAADGREIASVEQDLDDISAEEGEANARLMAAAPCLLAACEAALLKLHHNPLDRVSVAADMLRDAIAKAKGE